MTEGARRRLSVSTVALLFVLGCGVATTAADFEPFALPEGSTVVEQLDGPRDSVVAFYVEPFPFEVFCAVGIEEDRDEALVVRSHSTPRAASFGGRRSRGCASSGTRTSRTTARWSCRRSSWSGEAGGRSACAWGLPA